MLHKDKKKIHFCQLGPLCPAVISCQVKLAHNSKLFYMRITKISGQTILNL